MVFRISSLPIQRPRTSTPEIFDAAELSRNGSNDDARYGQDVIAVRPNQSGGGFLILGRRNDYAYFSGGELKTVQTGLAHVKFNDGTSKWKDRTRTPAPNTAGDLAPANWR